MESVKTQLCEITAHFNSRMAEFQKELKGSIPATSPSSNINAQFGSFRSFVLTALENLQKQVELLARQQDELEMRSRKKILLVHGVAELENDDPGASVLEILSQRLELPQLTADTFSRCHRLGHSGRSDGKPRAVLVKFKDLSLREKVWASKKKLKGTGHTISEFLNRSRHAVFVSARQVFGVTNSYTRDGCVVVIDSRGKRHRITTMQELRAIPTSTQVVSGSTVAPSATAQASKDPKALDLLSSQRQKRAAKK